MRNGKQQYLHFLKESCHLSVQKIVTTPIARLFFVRETAIKIFDPNLAEGLQFLPPHLREILLLFYCMEYSTPQIGRLLNLPKSTVHYRKREAICRLKRLLEGMEHEY